MSQKRKGQNIRISAGGTLIQEETNCTVTVNGNTEDTSTKSDSNLFTKEEVTSKSWQVQVESYDTSAATIKALLNRIIGASPVSVGFSETDSQGSATGVSKGGQALLTDFSLQANNRQTSVVSCQYTGTGALA